MIGAFQSQEKPFFIILNNSILTNSIGWENLNFEYLHLKYQEVSVEIQAVVEPRFQFRGARLKNNNNKEPKIIS